MRHRYNSNLNTKNFNFLLAMTGFLIVLLFAFSSQFPQLQKNFDKNYNNLSIRFYNNSSDHKYTSCILSIDDQVILQKDSTSRKETIELNLNIKKGDHKIEISTLDRKYLISDTFRIDKYPQGYSLQVVFQDHLTALQQSYSGPIFSFILKEESLIIE